MKKTETHKLVIDEYGNRHFLKEELARGGQGVVYRSKDADLAIKQPLDIDGNPDKLVKLGERFQKIRLLPLPPRIQISLPLAILKGDTPGYVMRLLNGMKPFSVFDFSGKAKAGLLNKTPRPDWLKNIEDNDMAMRLFYYARTGSTRRRLFALYKCAAILARIHCAGLVYGDISPNNVFVGEENSPEVWLIDADNMRFETKEGWGGCYTPHYGAPEIVRCLDRSRPRTDCWAFAVMAFSTLAILHPFIGKKVLEADTGWDDEPVGDGRPLDLDEQAYAGYLPFVDDEDDDSNSSSSGLPRELVATPGIRRLFQETFGAGRVQPFRRPVMLFWALELARAFDQSLNCQVCSMSYFAADHQTCPYCVAPRPPFVRARTPGWEILIHSETEEKALPHRLFNPFSIEKGDTAEYEAVINFSKKSVQPVRGTKPFPSDLSFEFCGGGQ